MKYLYATVLCFSLSACANESGVVATSTAHLTAHCASEGKKFVLASTTTAPSTVPLISQVTVMGYCE